MKTLFIGGTGNISLSCTREAVRRGIEIVHFNRGQTLAADRAELEVPDGVQTIRGDIRNADEARSLLADQQRYAFRQRHLHDGRLILPRH